MREQVFFHKFEFDKFYISVVKEQQNSCPQGKVRARRSFTLVPIKKTRYIFSCPQQNLSSFLVSLKSSIPVQ